ncbi:MAG TPA: F0F1 ATP synthase subunit delta [Usitatibacter sp.]|jgi:F-type H+-transporting ATPase subunit delta
MAEIATVARPYAEAMFQTALGEKALGPDADALEFAAAVARDETMRSVLSDPRVTAQQKKDLFASIGGERFTKSTKNLIGVLVDNHREVLIGSIAEQFEELKREHERVLHVLITSAKPLDDAQKSEIVASLEKRYSKKIEAEVAIDPQLMGGARVQVGDQVIHASVRDALAQMAAALTR